MATSHSRYWQGSPEPVRGLSTLHVVQAVSTSLRYIFCQVTPGTLWAPTVGRGHIRIPLGATQIPSTHPSWQVRGKVILMLSQCWGAPVSPHPTPCTGFHSLIRTFRPHLLLGSEGRGSGHSPCPTPGLTFCHKVSREASDEQAATNQQLPTWPWCRSWELMPSTKRRGSSQMSCREAERRPHCQHAVLPVFPTDWGPLVASFPKSSFPQLLPGRPFPPTG